MTQQSDGPPEQRAEALSVEPARTRGAPGATASQAAATAQRALEMAAAAGQQNLAAALRQRLQLYQSRRPFRTEEAGPFAAEVNTTPVD